MAFDVYTLGFSNRSWDETIAILCECEIQRVVDIRTLPGSRHTPQFNLDHMKNALPKAGIRYTHMKALGGFRKPLKDSASNAFWKNSGFRGYADYMQTDAFKLALQELIELVRESRTVYCCTEAVFWRCHRQLVSDALAVRGFNVGNIFGRGKVEPHKETPSIRLVGENVTYPALNLTA